VCKECTGILTFNFISLKSQIHLVYQTLFSTFSFVPLIIYKNLSSKLSWKSQKKLKKNTIRNQLKENITWLPFVIFNDVLKNCDKDKKIIQWYEIKN